MLEMQQSIEQWNRESRLRWRHGVADNLHEIRGVMMLCVL
jgi:hypothetical protein